MPRGKKWTVFRRQLRKRLKTKVRRIFGKVDKDHVDNVDCYASVKDFIPCFNVFSALSYQQRNGYEVD